MAPVSLKEAKLLSDFIDWCKNVRKKRLYQNTKSVLFDNI